MEATVFIDLGMEVGTQWAEQTDQEIRQPDVLGLLLRAESVGSEMVLEGDRRSPERDTKSFVANLS